MTRIPPEALRALRDAVPLSRVISYLHIPVKRRGRRVAFRCPGCRAYHTALSPHRNLARCFFCSRDFNPIDLVMAERQLSFLEAVHYLEDLLDRA